jgi:hypothetical protein
MSGRIKSGLSLLLMLLVFAASSQAAVCELACGLGAQSIVCHESGAFAKEDVPPAAMSHSHCVPAMHEKTVQAKSAAHKRTANLIGLHDVQCHHDFAPAISDASAKGLHLAAIHWTIVEIVPIATMLPETNRVVLHSPPPLYTPADSRLITLRV